MKPNKDGSLCEERTFSKVYGELFEKVRNYIYYKSGKIDDATDITQETLTRMWENCADVIRGMEANYAYSVANRLFLNQVRSEKVHLKFEKSRGSRVNEQNPEYLVLEDEFKKNLESALADLPEDQRVIFLQSRIDDMKYAEIAEFHGISIKTVEAKMGKAIRHLKENVADIKKYKF